MGRNMSIVISNLDEQEAIAIVKSLKEAKQSIAAKYKVSVVSGEKRVFEKLTVKCNKKLER